MVVRFFTMEQFHNKKDVGSTRIRVHNLIKHWPEAALYRYGEKADVMIFQKVYCTYDYKFPAHYPGVRILDVCDVDWKDTPDIYIKETIDAMDAVVVPTDSMRQLIAGMTDTPVHVIKDRFDLSEFPERKRHKGMAKHAAWFGYSHNAELLKFAVASLEKRGMRLTVISNDDPAAWRWADDPEAFQDLYTYVKYDQATVYSELQKADLVILPKGYRPEDKFKSENKTVIAQLLGLPVAQDAEELDQLATARARNYVIDEIYDALYEEYNCRKSVEEYHQLIKDLIRE